MRARRNFLFSGPTLHRAMSLGAPYLQDMVLMPPVQRGDIERVVQGAPRQPGVLIVVDGFFHLKTLAVGHAEIRTALRRGWTVWGLSSMGAIRACEMRSLGMRGYGECYDAYCADPDFRDDEVALLHEPDPPYREMSEPLIHMRRALSHLVAEGALSVEQEQRVLDQLLDMWFGDRDLPTLQRLLLAEAPANEAAILRAVRDFDRFRIKALDLLRYLDERIYLAA